MVIIKTVLGTLCLQMLCVCGGVDCLFFLLGTLCLQMFVCGDVYYWGHYVCRCCVCGDVCYWGHYVCRCWLCAVVLTGCFLLGTLCLQVLCVSGGVDWLFFTGDIMFADAVCVRQC